MELIYANSQCASIYYQMFEISKIRTTDLPVEKVLLGEESPLTTDQKVQSVQSVGSESFDKQNLPETDQDFGFGRKHGKLDMKEYMYIELAHYTDDDKLILVCVTIFDSFEVHEYKLSHLTDKFWDFLTKRFCGGSSSDQIINNVESLFASLEF